MNLEDFYQLNYNVLATDSQLEGTFHFKGETIINAKIKGTIIMSDFSKLIIERNAHIEGNIYGKDILVLGSVQGLIDSAGNVFFQATSELKGNVKSKSITIYAGANLNSQIITTDQAELS